MEAIIKNLEWLGAFIAISIATIILATIFKKIFGRYIKYNADVLQNDPTNYQFLKHTIVGIIYLVGFGWALYTLPAFKAVAGSLLTGAGILAVAVGIAAQHALSNIMSGIFLVVFKPFRVNDRLQIKETWAGIVEDITLRHTVIRNFENKRIIIPNSVISNEVIVNSDFSGDRICRFIEFKIGFDSNLKLAKQIIAEEIEKHRFNIDPRSQQDIENGVPRVEVKVIAIGDYFVNIRGWAWAINSPNSFNMNCDLLESIKSRLQEEGISLPYPIYNIQQNYNN